MSLDQNILTQRIVDLGVSSPPIWAHTFLPAKSYKSQSGDPISIPVSPCPNLSTHWPHTSSSSCQPPPPLTDWARSKYPQITAAPCTYYRPLKQLCRLMGVNLRGGGTCSSPLLTEPRVHDWICFLRNLSSSSGEWYVVSHQQNVTMCFSLFLTEEIWKHLLDNIGIGLKTSQERDLLSRYSKYVGFKYKIYFGIKTKQYNIFFQCLAKGNPPPATLQ